jgi:hypothetical protein
MADGTAGGDDGEPRASRATHLFIVYQNPADAAALVAELTEVNGVAPDVELQYFVRRHIVLQGKVYASRRIFLGADTLDHARNGLLSCFPWLVNIGRMNLDDPVIVEVWA